MTNAERNYRLLQQIDANRRFLLMAYRQNPKLLAQAEPRIRQLFDQPDARPAMGDDIEADLENGLG